jgi:hypothetical protein
LPQTLNVSGKFQAASGKQKRMFIAPACPCSLTHSKQYAALKASQLAFTCRL